MSTNQKPKIAFFDFTGCEGCQLTALDSLQTHPDLIEVVEIVQFRETMSEAKDNYQIAFIEGACSRAEDEPRLQAIRNQAEIVIALGACAHLGGVNALRAWQNQDEVRRYVYGEFGKKYPEAGARPAEAVIPVDGYLPGCPIDRNEFIQAVTVLIQGRLPHLVDYPMCIDCRLKENLCLFQKGIACLGPITRAGCGAICPTFGVACQGCRGTISNPNFNGIKYALIEHGFDENIFIEEMKLFNSYPLMESERAEDGRH